MRLIWTTDQVDLLRRFSVLLNKKGIVYSLDGSIDTDWAQESYGNKTLHLWIQDEDQMEQAEQLLKEFLQDPDNLQYSVDTSVHTPLQASTLSKQYLERKLRSPINDSPQLKASGTPLHKNTTSPSQTRRFITPTSYASKLLILLCSVILFFDLWGQSSLSSIPASARKALFAVSPVEKALLYDYPAYFVLLDKIVTLYGYDALVHPESLPEAGKKLYAEHFAHKPWLGIYPKVISFIQACSKHEPGKEGIAFDEKMFEKIQQGELWRLVSPIFLHADILHLFFNMIWVIILGIQIEARIGVLKYLAFITIAAIFSNTIQYLMCGPAFLGFSGVVCGMAFFIRARQKIASWEGYQMASATFHFIVFFIGILAGLSVLTFFMEAFQGISFPIQIANTAHLAGAAAGWFLGRLKFFSWSQGS